MYKGQIVWLGSLLLAAALLLTGGCVGSGKMTIQPSKQVQRDFFTCKGFAHEKPIDVTSEFYLEDGLIYIVADLEREQVGNRLDFEVTSPRNLVTYVESAQIEQDRPYGYYFDTQKLYDRGGPGSWKVLFWTNGEPVGRLLFNLEGDEAIAQGLKDTWSSTTGDSIFETLLGDEARPLAMPEAATEEAPILMTPEGVTLTPGETLEGEVLTPDTTWKESKPDEEIQEPPQPPKNKAKAAKTEGK